MVQKLEESGRVVFNREIGPGIYWLRAIMPSIAEASLPGQFLQVRVESQPSIQFLRMPFAVYGTDPQGGSVDICYQVVGEGTEQLTHLVEDDIVNFVGPIGNGWTIPEGAHSSLLVCGGVGTPALAMLASELASKGIRVDTVMGAQTKERVVCAEVFEQAAAQSGGTFHVTTDDGSAGTKGFANTVSDRLIGDNDYDYVAVCGPLPMERVVVKTAIEKGVPCEVSMEKLMACGVGACLGCVLETTEGLKRCCVDGPVFDASEVIW